MIISVGYLTLLGELFAFLAVNSLNNESSIRQCG